MKIRTLLFLSITVIKTFAGDIDIVLESGDAKPASTQLYGDGMSAEEKNEALRVAVSGGFGQDVLALLKNNARPDEGSHVRATIESQLLRSALGLWHKSDSYFQIVEVIASAYKDQLDELWPGYKPEKISTDLRAPFDDSAGYYLQTGGIDPIDDSTLSDIQESIRGANLREAGMSSPFDDIFFNAMCGNHFGAVRELLKTDRISPEIIGKAIYRAIRLHSINTAGYEVPKSAILWGVFYQPEPFWIKKTVTEIEDKIRLCGKEKENLIFIKVSNDDLRFEQLERQRQDMIDISDEISALNVRT